MPLIFDSWLKSVLAINNFEVSALISISYHTVALFRNDGESAFAQSATEHGYYLVTMN
jgi:hypothetical protein